MARIPRHFIADDGTTFGTAKEARAHNARPTENVEEFLATLDLSRRKVPEYTRLLSAYDAWLRQDPEPLR